MSKDTQKRQLKQKINHRSVPVRKDGLAGEYVPSWLLTRIAIKEHRKGVRYPVAVPPSNRCNNGDNE